MNRNTTTTLDLSSIKNSYKFFIELRRSHGATAVGPLPPSVRFSLPSHTMRPAAIDDYVNGIGEEKVSTTPCTPSV